MSKITAQTAAAIAYAYAEIEAAKNLLKTINERKSGDTDTDFRDVFGRRRASLELGVPSGGSGHRIFSVGTELAAIVIRAHIDAKHSEIDALCVLAKNELSATGETGSAGE